MGRFDVLSKQANLPAEVQGQMPQLTWFSATGHVNGGVAGTVTVEARDEEAAKNLRAVVGGFIGLAKMQAASKPELDALVQSITLNADSGNTVSVSFTVPSAAIEALKTQRTGAQSSRSRAEAAAEVAARAALESSTGVKGRADAPLVAYGGSRRAGPALTIPSGSPRLICIQRVCANAPCRLSNCVMQDPLPVLMGRRVVLREPREDDAVPLFEYTSDPDVTRFLAFAPPASPDDTLLLHREVPRAPGPGPRVRLRDRRRGERSGRSG